MSIKSSFYLTAKADSPEKSEAALETTATPTELDDSKPTENIDKSSAESELNANETDANDQASLVAKEQADVEVEPDLQSKTIVENANIGVETNASEDKNKVEIEFKTEADIEKVEFEAKAAEKKAKAKFPNR